MPDEPKVKALSDKRTLSQKLRDYRPELVGWGTDFADEVATLESENARLKQELEESHKRYIDLCLKWALASTKEQRESLKRSEYIPAEIWNLVLD